MSKRRFHRSSKNWCRYQIDTISHVCVDDDWHYVVEDPYATKPRQTPSYQAYSVNKIVRKGLLLLGKGGPSQATVV